MSNPLIEAITTFPALLRGDISVETRLQRTLIFACTLLHADLGILAPCLRHYPTLTTFTYNCTPERWRTAPFAFSRSLVIAAFQNPISTLTSDAQPDYSHDIARTIGLYSILCVPILGAEVPHGVLCLHRRLTTAPFAPDDVEILETIARLASYPLEDAGD